MANGVVKWYNDAKGFGFITPDDEGEDVFLHHRNIDRSFVGSIREGSRLSYEVQRGDKGPTAVNVRERPYWEK